MMNATSNSLENISLALSRRRWILAILELPAFRYEKWKVEVGGGNICLKSKV